MKYMEEAIQLLTFKPGDPETINQIHDYDGISLIFNSGMIKKGVGAVKDVFLNNYVNYENDAIKSTCS